MRAFLNVGGNDKANTPIPSHFVGWRHDMLDIDPKCKPDILADARDLLQHPGGIYDAVYCAHNMEHYHRHDAIRVVRGFHHVLKSDGFLMMLVPDIMDVMKYVITNNLDIDDTLYLSAVGPILVRDVIYGYHAEIESSGQDFFAHKTAYSLKMLPKFMADLGFSVAAIGTFQQFEIGGYFFKQAPTSEQRELLKL